VAALRHELSPREDEPTPVFAFPYDWRVDVRLTAAALGRFVLTGAEPPIATRNARLTANGCR
jgi:hypothetical protein